MMNSTLCAVTAIGLVAGMSFAGCDATPEKHAERPQESMRDAGQELKDARSAYLAEWQTFKRDSERQIDANEKSIEGFKDNMERAGPKIKAKYSKTVVQLEQRNRELKKKLDGYTDEGERTWQEFKANFRQEMDAIGKTVKDLFTDTENQRK